MKTIKLILFGLLFAGLASIGVTDAHDLSSTLPIYGAVEVISLFIPSGVLGVNSYADTVLLAAQAWINQNNNKKFEQRKTNTNVMEVFLKDREFTVPSLAAIRMAETQATEAFFYKKGETTITTTKSCDPVGQSGATGKVSLSWLQSGFVVTKSELQFDGNQVDPVAALANNLWDRENDFWTALDQEMLDFLETNKSGVNMADGQSGSFDATNDIMAIDKSNSPIFYSIVSAHMSLNNYNPDYNEVYSTMWKANRFRNMAQGQGNQENLQFQFTGFQSYESNLVEIGVIGGNNYTSIHYIVPDGGVAILDWNRPLNRRTKVSGDKTWFTMQSIHRPQFTFDVFKRSSCADTTTIGGGVQDYTEVWEFTLNYAFGIQPMTNAGETPIFKYGILDSDTFVS